MIGKKAEPYLLLLPAVALALMFSILPFMRTVFLSFMKVTQGGDVIGFGGLSSYKSLFADKARLALNTGTTFGEPGRGFMRLNVGCPRAALKQALDQLAEAVAGLKV